MDSIHFLLVGYVNEVIAYSACHTAGIPPNQHHSSSYLWQHKMGISTSKLRVLTFIICARPAKGLMIGHALRLL